MMCYKPWEIFRQYGSDDDFFIRRREVYGGDIVIYYNEKKEWVIHPFYRTPYWQAFKFKANTCESLMFQIDLVLIDRGSDVLEPFIFPDNNE